MEDFRCSRTAIQSKRLFVDSLDYIILYNIIIVNLSLIVWDLWYIT